jgi:hypothetical protein
MCIVVKEFGKYAGDKIQTRLTLKNALMSGKTNFVKNQFEDNFQFLPKKIQEVVP